MVTQHVGWVVMVDSQKDRVEMDYDNWRMPSRKDEGNLPRGLGGVMCDFDRFEIVEAKKHLFRPSNEIQRKVGGLLLC